MNEKNVTLSNRLLYYLIAPGLLLYFVMIDAGFLTPSFLPLAMFGAIIIMCVAIHLLYKKKNVEYKFDVNKLYANAMALLVIWELSYNFYK